VTGQKVWTSGGQHADLGMLIARTDPDAPKHKGISYFAIDMHQPGIDVRPLVEMTGRALFNEVFLDEARVPHEALIGGENAGWGVAMTTLANERAGLGGGGGGVASLATPGSVAGHLDRRAGDFVRAGRSGAGAALGGHSRTLIADVATRNGRIDDPAVRQDLIRLYTLDKISGWTVQRSRSGQGSGGEANIAKLMMSEMTRLSRELGLRVLGADGMLTGPDTAGAGIIQAMALFSPAVSIYGGSDQVQRNIIGERVLGLPKEPGDDKTVPFRELKVGTQTA
jgi:alkylation response protein AidB-like acyl-CoA dehydrogenase